MAIYNTTANVSNIEHTHTLQEFIAFGKAVDVFDYKRFCLIDKRNGTDVVVHNVLDDYIEELKDRAIIITLTPKQIEEYRYNPKKLSYKLYGTTTLYYIILKINNLTSTHEFTIKNGTLLLFRPTDMKDILSSVYNSEKNMISYYNNQHNNSDAKTANLPIDRTNYFYQ